MLVFKVHFAKNSVLQCLPSCCCLSPNQYIQQKTEIESEEQHRLITNESFIRNENFQRPYQYLTRLENEQDVSSYSFPLSTEVKGVEVQIVSYIPLKFYIRKENRSFNIHIFTLSLPIVR